VTLGGVPLATLAALTLEHLGLVAAATAIAALLGIPLGIVARDRPPLGRVIVAVAGGLQVVPSLALFGLLLPVPIVGGIGPRSAIVALVLYALLPIIRATIAGIDSVEASVREAAVAMGMTRRQILFQIDLPLGSAVIASGVRTALVIGVGVATVAAAIGAGGLGTLIFRGLRMNDNALVLAGAVPAALLAFTLDWALGALAARLRARGTTAIQSLGRTVATPVLAVTVLATALLFASQAHHDGKAAAPTSPAAISRRADSTPAFSPSESITVCSKDFTEQVILGEILAQGLEARGARVVRQFELGGNLCHQALLAGEVDVYAEYTGTAYTALLGHPPLTDAAAVLKQVQGEYAARFDLDVSAPLGFANDFVVLMRARDRDARGIHTLTDLARVSPPLRAGFGQDFLSRADGYAGLVRTYGLQFDGPPREMDLALTYRALADEQVDVIAGDSTNGLIDALGLAVVTDDRPYFPPYEAVWVARRSALRANPALAAEIEALAGALPTGTMRRLNREAEVGKETPRDVARRFRAEAEARREQR
jgi:osmoprotectant transport system permease protein